MNEHFEKLKSEMDELESLSDINSMILSLEKNFDDVDKKIKVSYEDLKKILYDLKVTDKMSKEELIQSLRDINLNLIDILSDNNRKIFKLLNSFRAITQTKIGRYLQ